MQKGPQCIKYSNLRQSPMFRVPITIFRVPKTLNSVLFECVLLHSIAQLHHNSARNQFWCLDPVPKFLLSDQQTCAP